jgi:hypothetical protein
LENQLNEAFTSWKKAQLDDSNMAVIYFTHRFALDFKNAKISKALLEDSPRLILEKFQFKKIKGKAIECLKRWHDGEWNLVLSEKIFTPFEVLDYQVQGIRPVTMKMKRFEDPILHRKSSLDFFVHDLEHGYMFFHDENLKNMQIRFFKDIKDSLDRGEWNERLKDADFREKFHYLISDMNTHEEHYKAYLQAII